jgi:lipoprotein-anchoring transpeptidase ErfK/SrfK
LTGDSSESRAKKAPAVLDAGAGASTATGPGTDDLALDGGVGDASGRVSNGTAAVAPQVLPFDPERRRKGLGGPIAFVTGFKARKYTRSADRRRIVAGEVLTRRTAIPLLGEAANIGGTIYEQAEAGYWVKATDIVATQPGPPPTDLVPKEKWIDVNLTSQTLVAFEGTVPVFATLVSSGKKNEEDPEKDHRTPPGSYRIWAKHVAATMDGDVASDGPYSIEDVPWIMYFQGSYALHGAFWHASFGQERSHGCVNLSPADARALFGWTDPPLPEGWHGIRSTDANPGTRVVVHE